MFLQLFRSIVCLFVIATWDCIAIAKFSTVINVPPDVAPSSIGSGTQVNMFQGGNIPSHFDAGTAVSTDSHTEVNVFGGTAGRFLDFFGGSQLNITGGTLGDFLQLHEDSSLNISGGSIGRFSDARFGSEVHISGGAIGRVFNAHEGSEVTILGGEYRLDGELITGLQTIGDSLQINLPNDSTLRGTLADGTPFVFIGKDFDSFADGTLTLTLAEIPPIGPPLITSLDNLKTLGIRAGQTLIISGGGALPRHFNAGPGSMVHVQGGLVDTGFDAISAHVVISDGEIRGDFRALNGSIIDIYGGAFSGKSSAHTGSKVNFLGGTTTSPDFQFTAKEGSILNISDGSISSLVASAGSEVNISGGSIGFSHTEAGSFLAEGGSEVSISGGSFVSPVQINSGSMVNLFGVSFEVDGFDLQSMLTRNVPFLITNRDASLTGSFTDGTPFSFDLNTVSSPGQDFVDAGALLSVTLVQPGDFDGDGFVSKDDLATWEVHFGTIANSPFTAGDGDGDRDADGGDFLVWQRNLIAAASALPATVPEPTAMALLLVGVSSVVFGVKRVR